MRIHIFQHVPFENAGVIEDISREAGYELSYTRFFEKYQFPEIKDFDLLIVMGGPMNIYEEEKYSWLREEKNFIRRCLQKNKKILGFCLGSQLLADVLGAKVYHNKEKEIGWFPVKPHPEGKHELLDLISGEQPAFHWHGDTFDLPEKAVPLFTSKATNYQGFVRNNIWIGLQFHWDTLPESVQSLLQHAKNDLTPGIYVQSPDEMLQETMYYPEMKNNLKTVLQYLNKKSAE